MPAGQRRSHPKNVVLRDPNVSSLGGEFPRAAAAHPNTLVHERIHHFDIQLPGAHTDKRRRFETARAAAIFRRRMLAAALLLAALAARPARSDTVVDLERARAAKVPVQWHPSSRVMRRSHMGVTSDPEETVVALGATLARTGVGFGRAGG